MSKYVDASRALLFALLELRDSFEDDSDDYRAACDLAADCQELHNRIVRDHGARSSPAIFNSESDGDGPKEDPDSD